MYNYQEDIKKSLGEISEKLNVEPKDRPAACNIHEEIANTLHDISEKVSEGGAGGGPVEDKSPVVIREYDLDNSIVIIPEDGGDNYIYPTFLDFQGYIASGRPIIYRTDGSGDAITYNVKPVQSLLRRAYDHACYLILNDQSSTGGYIQKIIYRANDQSSPFVRNRSYTFFGTSDS